MKASTFLPSLVEASWKSNRKHVLLNHRLTATRCRATNLHAVKPVAASVFRHPVPSFPLRARIDGRVLDFVLSSRALEGPEQRPLQKFILNSFSSFFLLSCSSSALSFNRTDHLLFICYHEHYEAEKRLQQNVGSAKATSLLFCPLSQKSAKTTTAAGSSNGPCMNLLVKGPIIVHFVSIPPSKFTTSIETEGKP